MNIRKLVRCIIAFQAVLIFGCSSGSTEPAGFGGVTVRLAWPNSAVAGKSAALAAQGVVTIKIAVLGPSMSDVQKDFVASSGGGTIEGIPAGNERVVTAQALDASGTVLYQGALTAITIRPNVVNDAGVISMDVPSSLETQMVDPTKWKVMQTVDK